MGQFFYVEYSLNVFVKHDSWNEFGEGASVTFPIRIHQLPLKGFFRRAAVDNLSLPEKWEPQQNLKKILKFSDIKTDYQRVIDVAEKKWREKMPHVMSKEEVKSQEENGEKSRTVKEVVEEFEDNIRMSQAK